MQSNGAKAPVMREAGYNPGHAGGDFVKVDKKPLTPFGREVKIRIVEKDLDQRKLAGMVKMHESYLSQMMRGERSGEKYVPQIAAILGIDLSKYTA